MKLNTGAIELDAESREYPIQYQPASSESIATVMAADENSDDGRSEWLWIRLPNDDLVLGVFPQGDTYFATETDHSA